MKWRAKDIERYLTEKSFIDTVLLPLIPIQWEEAMLHTVREGEFIQIVSAEAERQLTGRVILHPAFTYLKAEPLEEHCKRLEKWKQQLINNGFKFVYFVTSDVQWKTIEDRIEQLIWMPAVPLEHMNDRHRGDFIEENVGSIMKIITSQWKL
ncbi:hypothetical protein GCM10011391_17080 [Pullulanibacillus camelliae]|uniref:DUF2487 family protein n=1 Tax=Pullulanibacillus camelliae TaxID=1707096 RepID=A0A8J2YD36_9BACL|nr:YpiF family protein [Pullulanibacillus camelliae]GGE38861.1 hypothetical protein GCM10011391_17080 [Pullulanibacillus camelliae]